MSARVINIAEWKAKREAEIIREYMQGSYRPAPKRLSLDEIMGWPTPPRDGAA